MTIANMRSTDNKNDESKGVEQTVVQRTIIRSITLDRPSIPCWRLYLLPCLAVVINCYPRHFLRQELRISNFSRRGYLWLVATIARHALGTAMASAWKRYGCDDVVCNANCVY